MTTRSRFAFTHEQLNQPSKAALRARNPGLFPPSAERTTQPCATPAAPAKPTLRQDRKGMNKTEAAFFEWLKAQPLHSEIQREAIGIRLGNGVVYWGDFTGWVQTEDAIDGGSLMRFCVWETKGYNRPTGTVKIKVAARLHPRWSFYLVKQKRKRDGGGWSIEEVLP